METDERLEHGQYLLRTALAHMPKQGLDASDKREGDEKVNLKDKGDKNEEEETKKNIAFNESSNNLVYSVNLERSLYTYDKLDKLMGDILAKEREFLVLATNGEFIVRFWSFCYAGAGREAREGELLVLATE